MGIAGILSTAVLCFLVFLFNPKTFALLCLLFWYSLPFRQNAHQTIHQRWKQGMCELQRPVMPSSYVCPSRRGSRAKPEINSNRTNPCRHPTMVNDANFQVHGYVTDDHRAARAHKKTITGTLVLIEASTGTEGFTAWWKTSEGTRAYG